MPRFALVLVASLLALSFSPAPIALEEPPVEVLACADLFFWEPIPFEFEEVSHPVPGDERAPTLLPVRVEPRVWQPPTA